MIEKKLTDADVLMVIFGKATHPYIDIINGFILEEPNVAPVDRAIFSCMWRKILIKL